MTQNLAKCGIIAAACGVALLAGCSNRNNQAAQAAADAAAGGLSGKPAAYFTVPAGQMSHIELATVKRTDWPDVLRLPGTVDYDQFETTPVFTPVGGKVSRVLVVPGQEVKEGDPLLEIASPDYAQARDTYLKAADAYDLADRQYKRAQDLYAHQANALADVEQAASVRSQAQADLQAAEQNLRILGIPNPTPGEAMTPTAEIPLPSPISGQVVERDVAPGQLLQAGSTQCFVLSNMSKVWVLVNVYQSDLAAVHVGDSVEIDTNALARPFRGTIQFIAPAMDANTHTLQARIEVENPGGQLRKEMYVTATVQAGLLRNVIVVPDTAVLRDDENNPFVYVSRGNGGFAQQPVSLGQSHGGSTQITAGLEPGQVVAGDGSLFLQFAQAIQ